MFTRSQHLIHLGRYHATVMRRQGSRMDLVSESKLEGIELSAPEGLSARLLDAARSVPDRSRWTLLLDSCWLPITTFPTLDHAWMPHELKALACHRWTTLYGEAHGPWLAQTCYLPGDVTATAFGMSARLKAQLQAFSRDVAGKAVSIQPALLWAFAQFSKAAQASRLRQGWLWCEQDRCVAAVGQRGHLQVLAPGLDKRTIGSGLDALLPADLPAQVDAFTVAGLHPSLTLMGSAPPTLHGKPLGSHSLLAQSQPEARP